MWQKGQSGNPGGRAKGYNIARGLARTFTEEAINTLAEIMRNADAKDADRIRASEVLLNRGWGTAATEAPEITTPEGMKTLGGEIGAALTNDKKLLGNLIAGIRDAAPQAPA